MNIKTKIGRIVTALLTGAVMLTAAGTATFADTQEEAEVWEIPTAGMDIPLPESWSASGFYKTYQTMELDPELIFSFGVMYDMTEEELFATEEELGDSEELYTYLDEHINDLFAFVTAKDTLSKEAVHKMVADSSEDVPFTLTEVGKADGWTFYELSGENLLRRSGTETENGKVMAKILEELPEVFKNIRFYEPEKVPRMEKGTKLSFKTMDFEGKEVDSEKLFADHQYTMINLWTSWCTFCIEEMPELEEMNKAFAEKNCRIIGVMMDGDEEEALAEGKRIAQEAGVTFTLLIPTEEMKQQLVASGFPTTVFVDADGVVVSEPIQGMAPELYRETLEELLTNAGAEKTEEDKKAETSEEPEDNNGGKLDLNGTQGYRIIVQNENGDPVPGVIVQFCSDTECMMGTTDADGAAAYDVKPGTYTVHILKAPEGYQKDTTEYQAPAEPGDLVITLKSE